MLDYISSEDSHDLTPNIEDLIRDYDVDYIKESIVYTSKESSWYNIESIVYYIDYIFTNYFKMFDFSNTKYFPSFFQPYTLPNVIDNIAFIKNFEEIREVPAQVIKESSILSIVNILKESTPDTPITVIYNPITTISSPITTVTNVSLQSSLIQLNSPLLTEINLKPFNINNYIEIFRKGPLKDIAAEVQSSIAIPVTPEEFEIKQGIQNMYKSKSTQTVWFNSNFTQTPHIWLIEDNIKLIKETRIVDLNQDLINKWIANPIDSKEETMEIIHPYIRSSWSRIVDVIEVESSDSWEDVSDSAEDESSVASLVASLDNGKDAIIDNDQNLSKAKLVDSVYKGKQPQIPLNINIELANSGVQHKSFILNTSLEGNEAEITIVNNNYYIYIRKFEIISERMNDVNVWSPNYVKGSSSDSTVYIEDINTKLEEEWRRHLNVVKEIGRRPIGREVTLEEAIQMSGKILEDNLESILKCYDMQVEYLRQCIEKNEISYIEASNIMNILTDEYIMQPLYNKEEIEQIKKTFIKMINHIMEINNKKE